MALEETEVQRRSREKLATEVREIQKQAYKAVLDLAEVAVGSPDKFKPLRHKILGVTNDAIRKVERILKKSYNIEYVSTSEDIISIKH